eukprot:3780989-Pyramimonas_sp.AAC.1
MGEKNAWREGGEAGRVSGLGAEQVHLCEVRDRLARYEQCRLGHVVTETFWAKYVAKFVVD